MADFQFFLNRQGPRGPQGYKGDKGDDGSTPVPRTGINTPIETTVIFDTGDGNHYETPNLKYPIEDRGGNVVMLDRDNETQYYGTPDQATDNSYGVVKLATPESVLDDPLDSDVVTYELFDNNNQAIKTVTDSLAGGITQLNTDLGAEVTNRTNADTQLTNKINTDVGNEAIARNNADIALSGRIDGLNASKANKSDVYTKTQTDSLLNNKSNVGHTHNYNDLTNKPDIGNGTITFKQGNTTIGTITTNQLTNSTLTFADPTGITPGAGLDLNSSTNTLSVKVDNDTLGINSNGEIEVQNAGTTYSEGDAIDLTNDIISLKYDSTTLGINASNELYAKDTLPSQTGNSGKFLTTDGSATSWATVSQPDMNQYYTKTQTDSLLDGKINTTAPTAPLEYIPDTTSSITLHNINSTTLTDTRNNGYYTVDIVSGAYCHQLFLRDSVNNTYINLMENPTAINLDNLSYAEIQLRNGINIEYSISSNNIVGILGYYDNGIFVPKFVREAINASENALAKVENTARNFWQNNTLGIIYGMYKEQNNTNLVLNGMNNTGTSGTINSFTLSQQESDDLDACTHCRLIAVQGGPNAAGNSTINLNNIRFINPATSVTSGTTSDQYNTFINSDNLFDVYPESLSLKYDSTTLGVNASNELTVPTATTSNLGLVKPDNSTITVDGNGVISAINNSIAKTAPILPLKYEEQEDGVSVGIGGTLNHTNYTSSADEVWVYDVSAASIYTSNGGNFSQTATNMMSKIFYKGYKIRLDNGLNIAWNVAESSGFFMNVAIGYYNSGIFVPVLYALNSNSYGGAMFARTAMELGSDLYDMGRLNTQFTGCVGISLVGDVLSTFSPTNGKRTYNISNATLLAEFQRCTHAICTVVNKTSATTFDYSTGKFVNPTATLSDVLEVRNAVFSAAENLILNDEVTVIPELKLNYDSTYFKVVNNQLTLDIQAIKDAIDALSSSSGTASQSGGLGTGGWD